MQLNSTEESEASGTISRAKLEANRANAKLSTGPSPRGKMKSRFNAVKHGLTARVAWAGENPRQDERFFARAWERLGPRNAIEEISIHSLLDTRLRERWLVDAEKVMFTRRPVLEPDGEHLYPFLFDEKALHSLTLLTRQVINFTRAFNKDVEELLKVRKEQRCARPENVAVAKPIVEPCPVPPVSEPADQPKRVQVTTEFPGNSAPLEAFLREQRVVLIGDDALAYEALAQALWNAYQPANLLEEFVVADLIDTHWRLVRATQFQAVLLKKSAISASGANCGFGFGFIHDCQQHQGLDAMQTYESGLRKRVTLRTALFRKLRKQGWQDACAPEARESTELPADSATGPASAAPTASAPPASPLTSGSIPLPDSAPIAESQPPPAAAGAAPPDALAPRDETNLNSSE